MPGFELEKLADYSNEAVLKELKRVAALVPGPKLTISEFDKLSKVSSTTLRRRFGGWREALEAAGLGERFDDSNKACSREQIIEQLQLIAKQIRRNSVTKIELQNIAGLSDGPIRRLFGSYRAALEAAGLTQSPGGVRYTEEECYENLLAVWTTLGRQPRYQEMKAPPSRVGPKAYVSRWKSWRGALQAFVERVSQDAPTVEGLPQATDAPPVSNPPVKKRTPRDVPLGLRWAVFKRDRFRCVRCGKSPATHSALWLEADHIEPWSRDGETVIENLRTLCNECNRGKGASSDHPQESD
jgi:hypothetical protein